MEEIISETLGEAIKVEDLNYDSLLMTDRMIDSVMNSLLPALAQMQVK